MQIYKYLIIILSLCLYLKWLTMVKSFQPKLISKGFLSLKSISLRDNFYYFGHPEPEGND